MGGVRSTFPETAPGRAPATKLDYLGVWSARTGRDRSWAWDGDVELSCLALKYLCFLEEGVPIDERPAGFMEGWACAEGKQDPGGYENPRSPGAENI